MGMPWKTVPKIGRNSEKSAKLLTVLAEAGCAGGLWDAVEDVDHQVGAGVRVQREDNLVQVALVQNSAGVA